MYKNSLDVLVKMYQSGGLKSCYRGLLITLIRETPAFGCYFASFDIMTSTIFKVSEVGCSIKPSVFVFMLFHLKPV